MKIKFTLVSIFFLMVTLISYAAKPVITIVNKTDKTVLFYRSSGEKDVEPDIEQVEEAMKSTAIYSGGFKKIILTWRDLMLQEGRFYLGWEIVNGGRGAQRDGGFIFDINSGTGICSYKIIIENEFDLLKESNGMFCFGKIKVTSN